MTTWTSDELSKIGSAEELEIASLRADGTLRKSTTIWVVRVGDDLYIRSSLVALRHVTKDTSTQAGLAEMSPSWTRMPTRISITRLMPNTGASTNATPQASSTVPSVQRLTPQPSNWYRANKHVVTGSFNEAPHIQSSCFAPNISSS